MAKGYLPARQQFAEANARERKLRREFGELGVRDTDEHFKLNLTVKCEQCGQMAFEVQPFGPGGISICEDCADKLEAQASGG